MQSLIPTWWVEYAKRRPTLTRPLTHRDYERIEVSAIDEPSASRAVVGRFGPGIRVVAVYMASATGFA